MALNIRKSAILWAYRTFRAQIVIFVILDINCSTKFRCLGHEKGLIIKVTALNL